MEQRLHLLDLPELDRFLFKHFVDDKTTQDCRCLTRWHAAHLPTMRIVVTSGHPMLMGGRIEVRRRDAHCTRNRWSFLCVADELVWLFEWLGRGPVPLTIHFGTWPELRDLVYAKRLPEDWRIVLDTTGREVQGARTYGDIFELWARPPEARGTPPETFGCAP